jgi:hypothetical protein
MRESGETTRQLKKKIERFLLGDDFISRVPEMIEIGERRVVNPMFSFFCHHHELLKWRSITAMGMVVDHLAGRDPESARVVMRRLMWSLNDESGGIGWGAPEAMGEVMTRNAMMAKEYCRMLISYINPEGNFLEHEILQRGALWGFARLAHARPHLTKDGAGFLNPFMISQDTLKRGLAAWAAGPLKDMSNRDRLTGLLQDASEIRIYMDGTMKQCTVGRIAENALKN